MPTIRLLFSFRWEFPSTSILVFVVASAGLAAWVLPQYLQILFYCLSATFYVPAVRTASWKGPLRLHRASRVGSTDRNGCIWKTWLVRLGRCLLRVACLFDVLCSLMSAARPQLFFQMYSTSLFLRRSAGLSCSRNNYEKIGWKLTYVRETTQSERDLKDTNAAGYVSLANPMTVGDRALFISNSAFALCQQRCCSYSRHDGPSVCPSVRPSVRLVSCQNDAGENHDIFTDW